MTRRNEQGFAMIVALFMVLALSVLASSMMFVSRTETVSSHSYRLMSQARYAAESGLQSSANYLINTYAPPTAPGVGVDPINAYTTTTSPVTWGNAPVVLSSNPNLSNYPVAAVKTAFAAASKGTLDVKDGKADYTTTATLMSMRQFFDEISLQWETVQTWQLTGVGAFNNISDPAQVEVTTVLETQPTPVYAFAAFATYNGCAALNFFGGATTDSYSSSQFTAAKAAGYTGRPVVTTGANGGGNVGTNGNLDGNGNPTVINGTMSTPRKGVGSCSANAVTAATLSGKNIVAGGLITLSQPIKFPTPDPINPLPPTGTQQIKSNGACPASVPYCTVTANGKKITAPANTTVTLADLDVSAGAELTLTAGTYVVNSFTMNGNASLKIDNTNGPVVIKVAGVGIATPIVINGNGISNPSYVPSNLRFIYGGTGEIKLNGGDETSAVFYAPNASATINGNADIYGALVIHDLKESGGAVIHYDRDLAANTMTAGNPSLSAFSWSSY